MGAIFSLEIAEVKKFVFSVVGQFELRGLRTQGRSLVPLVKTRDFGMTPRGNFAVWR